MDYFIRLIKEKHNKDISKDNKALGKLRREYERGKRALSSQDEVRVEIESLFDGIGFSEPLTRARFEELNMELFKMTMGRVKKALKDAGLKKTDIHEIVLVGGSTRIPKIRQLLKDFFDGKEPSKGIHPDEAVAYGAAVQGGLLSGEKTKDILLFDVEIEKLVEEREEKDRIDARKRLERYIYNMRSTMNNIEKLTYTVDLIDEKVDYKLKMDLKDREKFDNTLKEAVEWLNANQNANTKV
ncbi:hypothetical protein Dsin_023670 [Dipteronia sinensis]|uniref:Heat shock protein 70 n=1 Tax=Dipteronia sinensis TaxID=43782 RepID=A0AAE0A4C6_9ROSI|nr:hypothetical protein Dsin_023670 [Dipteronia sinensis]